MAEPTKEVESFLGILDIEKVEVDCTTPIAAENTCEGRIIMNLRFVSMFECFISGRRSDCAIRVLKNIVYDIGHIWD